MIAGGAPGRTDLLSGQVVHDQVPRGADPGGREAVGAGHEGGAGPAPPSWRSEEGIAGDPAAGPWLEPFDLADALARIVGGPAGVMDPSFLVLGYSSVPGQADDELRRAAIHARRPPAAWLGWVERSGTARDLASASGPVRVRVPTMPFAARWFQPVRSQGELVGYLCVTEGAGVHDVEENAQVMARLAAPPLAARAAARRQGSADAVLTAFLHGHATVGALLHRLGAQREEPAVLAVVEAGEAADGAARGAPDLLEAVRLHQGSPAWSTTTGWLENKVYVLWRARTPGDRLSDHTALARLGAMAERVHRVLAADVRAAVGAVGAAGVIAASQEQAELALAALPAKGPAVVVGSFPSMRYRVLAHEMTRTLQGRTVLTQGLLEGIDASSGPRHEEHLSSVRAYLEAFGDVRKAAARLHIHPNSLRYRLSRIAEHGGPDLEDPDVRLALQVLLRSTDHAR